MDTQPGNGRSSLPARIWNFYYSGFRQMKLGRTLWMIILLKLFIMFAVLKLFFFPDILKRDFTNDADRAEAVRKQLTEPR